MRIHEIILEDQSVDEGFFKDIVGKAGGHVAGALGAAGRAAANAWSDTKAGYADAKQYWDAPKPIPSPSPSPAPEPSGEIPPSTGDRLAKIKADRAAKDKADRDQRAQQIAATNTANAAKSKEDAAIKAAADAAKAKPTWQQTASDRLAIKAAKDRGIGEDKEKKKKTVVEFYSKFLGKTI